MSKLRDYQQQDEIQSVSQQRNMEGGESSSQSNAQQVAATPQQAVGEVSNDINKEVPDYSALINSLIPGYTTALTGAANQGTASSLGADTGLYNFLAPYLNQTTQGLSNSNLLSNAGGIANTLNSPQASGVVSGFNGLQNQLNPAYASTLGNLSSLMANQNPNALSGSEQAQVERGLNQTNYQQGNMGVGNPLTEINNAVTFGTGLQQKQANFANLAGSTANTANTLTGGQNAFGLSTGQPSGASSASTSANPSQFLTNPNNILSAAGAGAGLGAGLTGQTANTFGAANSAASGQQTSGSQSINAGVSSGCCWIMIYGNGGALPWFVRKARDVAYQRDLRVSRGYTKMANWLVPLMMLSKLINILTCELMVIPLTEHAGYINGIRGCKPRTSYYKFWHKIWMSLGKEKQ